MWFKYIYYLSHLDAIPGGIRSTMESHMFGKIDEKKSGRGHQKSSSANKEWWQMNEQHVLSVATDGKISIWSIYQS